MLNQLTQDQFEQLRQHLIVPLAISDILHHDLAVEPEMQYGLHLALSEIDPDSALLAIALCAVDIADKNIIRSPIASALRQEAHIIIEDYGPTWLRHFKSGPMPPEAFEEVLQTVPEDLEALADLMDALCSDLNMEMNETTSASIMLANLLSIQTRAHMEIAEYILEEIDYEKAVKEHNSSKDKKKSEKPMREPLDMESYKGSNIILFPGTSRS